MDVLHNIFGASISPFGLLIHPIRCHVVIICLEVLHSAYMIICLEVLHSAYIKSVHKGQSLNHHQVNRQFVEKNIHTDF
jgi:hypothetical protein